MITPWTHIHLSGSPPSMAAGDSVKKKTWVLLHSEMEFSRILLCLACGFREVQVSMQLCSPVTVEDI